MLEEDFEKLIEKVHEIDLKLMIIAFESPN